VFASWKPFDGHFSDAGLSIAAVGVVVFGWIVPTVAITGADNFAEMIFIHGTLMTFEIVALVKFRSGVADVAVGRIGAEFFADSDVGTAALIVLLDHAVG
jgi:CBS domain containing-hemolysin-like protein